MNHHTEETRLWERALSQLSDTTYLDIIRNFIATIPTPFHKPQLTTQLTALFTQSEFQNQVLARLSADDTRLISAVWLLEHPTQDEVCRIFSRRIPYAQLWQQLVNLEERLLVVPNPDRPHNRNELMINPLLRSILEPYITPLLLFRDEITDKRAPQYRFQPGNRTIVRALISLHIHEDLGNRERSERIIRNRFIPSVFTLPSLSPEIILQYNQLLFDEHVLKERGKQTRFILEMAQRLLEVDTETLLMHLCLSAWRHHMNVHIRTQGAIVQQFFSVLINVLTTVPVYTDEELITAVQFALYRAGISHLVDDQMIAFLCTVGLTKQEVAPHSELPSQRCTIDSDLTITYSGILQSVDTMDYLHLIAIVRKVDVLCTYEITKLSMMRAYDIGLSESRIITYLQELTSQSFGSLKILMQQWREEFSSLVIYDGIVVVSDERQSRIIEALPQLQDHIIARIGSGMYLFSRKSERTWREILTTAGSGLLPSSITEEESSPVVPQDADSIQRVTITPLPTGDLHEKEPIESQHTTLRKLIITRTSDPSERNELLDRLERKLVLIPSQIQSIRGPSQTLQASGFDHQGKVNLCKTAVKSAGDLIELHLLDDQGNTEILLAEAKEVIKSGSETAVRVHLLPDGQQRVIPINLVFKLRKLRRSIFFEV